MELHPMLNKKLFILLTAIGMLSMTSATFSAEKKAEMEKCLGLAKTGMGDGKVVLDGKDQEWLLVPVGSCEKFVDGRVYIAK